MSRPRGSIIGARPTWTTTATSGIWTLRQAEEMKADGKWPRGPVAPASLAGAAGDELVELTWTVPATTHGTITDYLVEYTPAAGSPTVVATGSTAASYTLTGLTNGTEYTFRVAAVNHTRGDWSDSVAVTPSAVVPDPYFANVSLLLHMDGSGSTFTDSSGTPKTVTALGSVAQSTGQSKFGGLSALFGTGADTLDVSDASPTSSEDWVIEGWFYKNGATWDDAVHRYIYDAGLGVGNGRYQIFVNFYDNTIRLGRSGIGTIIDYPFGSLSAGQWYYLAWSHSSGVYRFYIDGSLVSSSSDANVVTASTSYRIGGTASDGGFNGYIDDFRITKGSSRGYTGATIPVPTAAFPDA